jgi:hypothetical protein
MILVLAWEMAVMTPPIPAGAGAAVAVPAELAAVAEDDELDARPVPGGQPLGPSALGTPHWLSTFLTVPRVMPKALARELLSTPTYSLSKEST